MSAFWYRDSHMATKFKKKRTPKNPAYVRLI